MKCPDVAILRFLLQGKLNAQEFRPIEAHVEECAACKERLHRLVNEGEAPATPSRKADPFETMPQEGAEGVTTGVTAPSVGNRYLIKHFHARGGLGEVFVAVDRQLNRDVALKRVQARFQDDIESRHRFLQEAEITARLEHPGVVPVYGMDHDTDGQASYAMRFIRGETQLEAIKRFHEADKPGRDPGERSLAMRELLSQFVAICNTVAYAHSRGILHRDLKPANIMLGKYGETLVVDWGLAKSIERDETARAAGEETLTPASASGDSETQVGVAMGTPSHMSPEQASGDWARIGPASDIYSLGTILYSLLTGKAPFAGFDLKQKLEMVKKGEFSLPRKVKKECPAALEAVCLKAMALRPDDRYATALAMAEDVQHWLADEPVKAWEEPWTIRARRWVRRHRTLATATATAVLLAALTGGAILALEKQHRAEQKEQTEGLLDEALGAVESLRGEARAIPPSDLAQQERQAALWGQALTAAGQAERVLATPGVVAEVRNRTEELIREVREEARDSERDRRMIKSLDEALEKSLEVQDSDYVRMLAGRRDIVWGSGADPAFATAFKKYGIDLGNLAWDESAKRIRDRPIARQLAEALDYWYFIAPEAAGSRLLDVARAADPDQLRSQVRLAVGKNDAEALKTLAENQDASRLPPSLLILLTDRLHQNGLHDLSLRLIRRGQREHANDFFINDHAGIYCTIADPPDYSEACRYFAAAIALRPSSSVARSNLGATLVRQGDLDAAVSVLRESIRGNPRFTTSYNWLSTCLILKGVPDQALGVVKEGLRVAHEGKKLNADSPMLLTALGEVYKAQGKLEDAIAAYRRALDREPKWLGAQWQLADALSGIGKTEEALNVLAEAQRLYPHRPWVYLQQRKVFLASGDVASAARAFQKAVELRPWDLETQFVFAIEEHVRLAEKAQLAYEKVAPRDSEKALQVLWKAVKAAPRNSVYRQSLATTLGFQGRLDEAVAMAREAIQLDPANANAHIALGQALNGQKKYAEAEGAVRHAVKLWPDHALLRSTLGQALVGQKKYREACAEIKEAIRLDGKQWPYHYVLGSIYYAQQMYTEAIPHFEEATRLRPKIAVLHESLGDTFRLKGDSVEAIDELRLAAKLDPKSASIQTKLALAFRQAKKYGEAIKASQQAVRIEPQNVSAHNALALALEDNEKWDEASTEYRECTRLAPRDAVGYSNLGLLLMKRKHYSQAIASLREATHWKPLDAVLHSNLANALYLQKQYADAAEAAEKAITLDPKSDQGHNLLGLAFAAQARHADAIPHFKEAIRQNPKDSVLRINLGNSLVLIKDLDGASKQLREALTISPENLVALNYLVNISYKQGEYSQAEPLLRKLLEIKQRQYGSVSAEVAGVLATLGLNLLTEGKYSEAEPVLRQCLTIRQKKESDLWMTFSAKSMLGLSLLGQKKYDKAEPLLLQGTEGMNQRRAMIPPLTRPRLIDALEGLVQLYDAWDKQDEKAKWQKIRDAAEGYRYEAACSAVLTAARKGLPPYEPKEKLRARALKWLHAELDGDVSQSRTGDANKVFALLDRLSAWKKDANLASVREPKALAVLADNEQASWRKFWAEVDQAISDLTRGTMTQIAINGALTTKERTQGYETKLAAGTTYVIEMHSTDFDSYLRLLDDKKSVVAENDDIAPDNVDARVIYTPMEDRALRIVATSFQERGTGAYTVTIRTMSAKVK